MVKTIGMPQCSVRWRMEMDAHSNVFAAVVLFFGLWSFATTFDVSAQGYPNRAIRIVVAFAPGGGADTNARIVAQRLSEQLAVPVIVDNRPGAGSMLGTELVARAPADGYTLLLGSSEFAVNPSLQPKIPYDTLRDFAPIAQTV